MKKKAIVFVLLLAMLLCVAVYRVVHVFPYPMGGGQYRESPDKKFTASAWSMTDRFFLGGERRYYEFEIESGPRQQVRRIVIDEPSEGMIDWREEGSIEWAADSSAVAFRFKGSQLILNVKP